MDPHHLRALILKIQDYLSDDDRKRLHFFLGPDIPRRIRDDPTLKGTLNLMESLFDQDKINERDFTFLINAFDEIQCFDAVNILTEHMKRMQASGQNQSILSLPSILYPEEEEDKYARETFHLVAINQRNNDGNNNIIINNNEINIDPVTVVINPKRSLKSFMMKPKFLLLFGLLLIIGLVTVTGVCVIKIGELKSDLETKNTMISVEQKKNNNSLKANQRLTDELNMFKHVLRWKQDGLTIAGGNGQGDQLNQIDHPSGIYIDNDHQSIYINDFFNNRIVQWKFGAEYGQVVAGGNGQGNRIDQLSWPRDVIDDQKNNSLIICDAANRRIVRWARENGTNGQIIMSDIDCSHLFMNKNGDLYVANPTKDEVRRWKQGETEGILVAGGNGRGNKLNQLNQPYFIFVDENESVYVSDCFNDRVVKWMRNATEGIVVAGGNYQGSSLTQLYLPSGVFVDKVGRIYVADSLNHRVVCWLPESTEGRMIVGGNGKGKRTDQLTNPSDIAFDEQNNLFVADEYNNRIQQYDYYN